MPCFPAAADEAPPAGSRPSLLGGPADLSVRCWFLASRGAAGFAIDSDPFESRLDFPLDAACMGLRAESRPFAGVLEASFYVDVFLMAELAGMTDDTDWFEGMKWLFSRTDTSGYSAGFRAGGALDVVEGEDFSLTLGASFLFQRDVFKLSRLRQYCFIQEITWMPDFFLIDGDVATFELRGAAIFLDARADLPILGPFSLSVSLSVSPIAYLQGFGNWKLRKYRFYQYGLSFFTSVDAGAELVIRLASWSDLRAGVRRLEWRADFCAEDGSYADSPEFDYEDADIVKWMRHLQYGCTLSLSITF